MDIKIVVICWIWHGYEVVAVCSRATNRESENNWIECFWGSSHLQRVSNTSMTIIFIGNPSTYCRRWPTRWLQRTDKRLTHYVNMITANWCIVIAYWKICCIEVSIVGHTKLPHNRIPVICIETLSCWLLRWRQLFRATHAARNYYSITSMFLPAL